VRKQGQSALQKALCNIHANFTVAVMLLEFQNPKSFTAIASRGRKSGDVACPGAAAMNHNCGITRSTLPHGGRDVHR